jgi:hypothetical protein
MQAAADSWPCLRRHRTTSLNTMDWKPEFPALRWYACVAENGFARRTRSKEGSDRSLHPTLGAAFLRERGEDPRFEGDKLIYRS